ncbi:HAMP-domain two-component sensor histidine kinase [Candidatus Hepatincolaceae symbiont of Richtersius coronifer]
MKFNQIKNIIYEKRARKRLVFLLKLLLPKTLLIRALLIIGITLLVLQIIFIIFFYDNNWRKIRTSLIKNVANNIAYIVSVANNAKNFQEINTSTERLSQYINLYPQITVNDTTNFTQIDRSKLNSSSIDIYEHIKALIPNEIYINEYNNNYSIINLTIHIKDNIYITFYLTKELFLVSSISYIVIFIIILYMIVILITLQFFRLQIRPLTNLAKAAKKFGKGEKIHYLVPSGSIEIREATIAFNEMKDSIELFIEQKTMMLSAISHDLKTALTKMNLIIDINPPNATTQELKEQIADMTNMLVSYLDYARDEYYSAPKHTIVINKFFSNIIKSYTNLIDIHITYQQNPKTIRINSTSFKRALDNILNNASKYAKVVVIKVKNYTNHSIIIEIHDNGVGIPPEKYENVFKPFYKLNEARTPEKGSVGLGLYIVKEIIIKQGGHIFLEQSSLGGVKINIILPF